MKRIITKLKRYTADGEWLPKGYRVAYHDWIRQRYVCYPLGIHWLVRWARNLWQCTYSWRPTVLDAYVAQCVRVERKRVEERYRQEQSQKEKPTATDMYQEFLSRPPEEQAAVLVAARKAMKELTDDMQQEVWKSEYSDPPEESP